MFSLPPRSGIIITSGRGATLHYGSGARRLVRTANYTDRSGPGREWIKIIAMDETGVKVAGTEAYLFIAYEPLANGILGLYFAWDPNSVSVEMFPRDLIGEYMVAIPSGQMVHTGSHLHVNL